MVLAHNRLDNVWTYKVNFNSGFRSIVLLLLYVPQAIIYDIGAQKRIATESEWVFAMIEHNLYFKSSVIEKTLIKSLTFQHLRKLFVEHFQFPI